MNRFDSSKSDHGSDHFYCRISRREKLVFGDQGLNPPPAFSEVEKDDLVGLALSGGGIRSASFCLGFLQALEKKGWMKRIDYLSTVSGGGYIGSSLSWFKHAHKQERLDEYACAKQGELDEAIADLSPRLLEIVNEELGKYRSQDPGGSEARVGAPGHIRIQDLNGLCGIERRFEEALKSASTEEAKAGKRFLRLKGDLEKEVQGVDDWFPFQTEYGLRSRAGKRGAAKTESDAEILRHLRQNSKYLTPGDGHDFATLVYVLLRGLVQSVVVYFPLLTGVVLGLDKLGWFSQGRGSWHIGVWDFSFAVPQVPMLHAPFLLWIAVWLLILGGAFALLYGLATRFSTMHLLGWTGLTYRLRRGFESVSTLLLKTALALAIVGSLPLVHDALVAAWSSTNTNVPEVVGLISTVLGVLTSMGVFRRTQAGKASAISTTVMASVAAGLIIYGLLLLAYGLSVGWLGSQPWWVPVTALLVVLIFGLAADLNLVSIHRYYRDRLMETFMPDLGKEGKLEQDVQAIQAETTALSGVLTRPYQLINSNVVLVGSGMRKYRGRGGDNFVLSPMCSGSEATGWVQTNQLFHNELTLATAMAISGAALNPNTGVAGEGATRSRIVSFLLTFLNIRLGFWIDTSSFGESKAAEGRLNRMGRLIRTMTMKMRIASEANLVWPGVPSLLQLPVFKESAALLELTDGGHFENLGLYELVRRRCKVIIACDAGADPKFDFADLANAIEKVRADFGVIIDIPSSLLEELMPADNGTPQKDESAKPKYAKRGFVVARIKYPKAENEGREVDGILIYVKTTFYRSLRADLYGYRAAHPSFPDEPTFPDQFFDEKQFEAYRELGYTSAFDMMMSVTNHRVPEGEEDDLIRVLRSLPCFRSVDSNHSPSRWLRRHHVAK